MFCLLSTLFALARAEPALPDSLKGFVCTNHFVCFGFVALVFVQPCKYYALGITQAFYAMN